MKDSKSSILKDIKNLLNRISLLGKKEKDVITKIRSEKNKIEIEKVKENINNL